MRVRFALAAASLLSAAPMWSQTPPADSGSSQTSSSTNQDASGLAKQLANPVASLISVPFQSNWESGVGPDEDTRFVLNIQPVMPFSLNEDWNAIGRVIAPTVSLTVRFGTLAEGATIYPAHIALEAKAKQVIVVNENSGYRKLGM